MSYFGKFFLPLFLGAFIFLFVTPVYALQQLNLQDQINAQLGGTATKAEVGAPVDPRIAVASIIQVFLTLLGTVFFVLIIMSGYWLITARGEEEKETRAKDTIRSAVVGLAIVLMAYAITVFVSARLYAAVLPAQRSATQDPRCTHWYWSWSRSVCP